MTKIPKWKHAQSPYEVFQLLMKDPRVPMRDISKKFKINLKTAEIWWNHATERRIITIPVFRRKCFSNFYEYFYFLNTDDPHRFFIDIQQHKSVLYSSVETGFSNFLIISKKPLSFDEEIVLEGCRSDYYVSVPPDQNFETAVKRIRSKLKNINSFEHSPSPLIFRNCDYTVWDDNDEKIYESLCNNLRKPFSHVLKETKTYSDKILKWYRSRDNFGNTIIMFFPDGDSSYILLRYFIDVSEHFDSLLINIFSELPTSTVFYRLGKFLVASLYLPFSTDGRKIAREVLSVLKSERLVNDYTNTFVEYGYRPD